MLVVSGRVKGQLNDPLQKKKPHTRFTYLYVMFHTFFYTLCMCVFYISSVFFADFNFYFIIYLSFLHMINLHIICLLPCDIFKHYSFFT